MSQSPAPASSRPPASSAFQLRAWTAVLMTLIGFFSLFGGIAASMANSVQRGVYPMGVAVLIAAVALWLAVTSMTRARRLGGGRPRGAVFAIVLGVIGVGFGVLMLASFAASWPQMTQLSQCEHGANTITAQNDCYQQFINATGVKGIKLMPGAGG